MNQDTLPYMWCSTVDNSYTFSISVSIIVDWKAHKNRLHDDSLYPPQVRRRNCKLAKFTWAFWSPGNVRLLFRMSFGYYYRLLLLYSDFSDSRQNALWALPVSYWLPNRYPLGLFLHCRRLLLRPRGPYLLMRTLLRYLYHVSGFRLPTRHHWLAADLPSKYSNQFKPIFHVPRSTDVLCASSWS